MVKMWSFRGLLEELFWGYLSVFVDGFFISRLSDIENDISGQQKNADKEGYKGEEGTADGLQPANSLVFAVLEIAFCLLVRQACFWTPFSRIISGFELSFSWGRWYNNSNIDFKNIQVVADSPNQLSNNEK